MSAALALAWYRRALEAERPAREGPMIDDREVSRGGSRGGRQAWPAVKRALWQGGVETFAVRFVTQSRDVQAEYHRRLIHI